MRSLTRPLAATVLVAAAGLVWAAPPATASVCSSDSGVTVVVDFKQLGGGVQTGCVSDRGTADDLFVAAGHSLENVQGQAFVCRVDGLPTQEQEACVRTPPADAYWGLFWSDGESGTWTYSSAGAYSLDVPDGGSVAFAWQGSTSRQAPGVAPPKHEPEAQPTKPPTQQPSQPPKPSSTPSSSPSGTPSASPDSPTGSREPRPEKTRDRPEKPDRDPKPQRETESPEPTDEVTPSTTPGTETAGPPSDAAEDGLPVWVGPAAVGGLFGVAGVAVLLRRRGA